MIWMSWYFDLCFLIVLCYHLIIVYEKAVFFFQ